MIAHRDDGSEVDVTEGVQALYDHVIQSMDWGSGFLTVEDATGIIKIAQACGFLTTETGAAAFEEYARSLAHGWGSNIICATCGEYARYEYVKGWSHKDSEPGHPVTLWR